MNDSKLPEQSSDSIKNESKKEEIIPLSGVSFIWGKAFAVYKERYEVLLVISALMTLPHFLYTFVLKEKIVESVFSKFGLVSAVAFGVSLVLITLVASSYGSIALILAIKEKEISASDAYNLSWDKLLSYWWVFLLTGFVVTGGFAFFFVPGFILSVYFCVVSYVLILEDEKGMNVLLKCREYVKGRVWDVFAKLMFLALSILVFSVAFFTLFVGIPDPWKTVLSENIFSILIAPLSAAYLYVLYLDLVLTKGEFVFVPEKKIKNMFTMLGAVGCLLVLFVLVVIGWYTIHPDPVLYQKIIDAMTQ